MKKYLSYSLWGSAILLLGTWLSSCQKEGAAVSTASNSATKANLTVGLPPILMGWGPGVSISYGGFAIDGKGYVVSGYHSAGQTGEWGRTVWQYDPTSDQWTEKTKFPGTARVDAVAVNATIGGADVGLLVGGELENAATGDSWEYYPPNDSWVRLPMGGGGLRSQAAGFVIGNSLYVANITLIVLGWSR